MDVVAVAIASSRSPRRGLDVCEERGSQFGQVEKRRGKDNSQPEARTTVSMLPSRKKLYSKVSAKGVSDTGSGRGQVMTDNRLQRQGESVERRARRSFASYSQFPMVETERVVKTMSMRRR